MYHASVDKFAIAPNYIEWFERRENGIEDQSMLIPLKYILNLDRGTGFYFELNGRYICPKEYANCITSILYDLFLIAISKTFLPEDIREAEGDLSNMTDSCYATNLLEGIYNPFNMLHRQFSIDDAVYLHYIGQLNENRKTT